MQHLKIYKSINKYKYAVLVDVQQIIVGQIILERTTQVSCVISATQTCFKHNTHLK